MMDSATLFTVLLWGTGAMFGHLLILAGLMWMTLKFGRMGKLIGVLGGIVMMLAIFNNMPSDNFVYIMVVPYFIFTVSSALSYG